MFRKSAFVVRAPEETAAGLRAGGGVVAPLVWLLPLHVDLFAKAPLASYRVASCECAVIFSQTTRALRELLPMAGMQRHEFALHSLPIAGATRLSAGGVASHVLREQTEVCK